MAILLLMVQHDRCCCAPAHLHNRDANASNNVKDALGLRDVDITASIATIPINREIIYRQITLDAFVKRNTATANQQHIESSKHTNIYCMERSTNPCLSTSEFIRHPLLKMHHVVVRVPSFGSPLLNERDNLDSIIRN
jgi:hypothetical protein